MSDRTSVAYGYARVSTDRQATEGISLDGQGAEIRDYYSARLKPSGVVWGEVYADGGVSAFRKTMADRKAGSILLSRVLPGDHIIMTALDRGFRSALDAWTTIGGWIKLGVNLHFIRHQIDGTTPIGKLLIGQMALFAEFERNLISERTREAMRAANVLENKIMPTKRKYGTFNGQPPLGWKMAGRPLRRRLVPDHEERRLMRFIEELHDEHGLSFDDIYLHFWKNDILAREGREWNWGRIRNAYYACKGLKPNRKPLNPRHRIDLQEWQTNTTPTTPEGAS